jgi:uncharacterized protein
VEREVMWAPWEGPGLEHLRLVASDDGAVANGLVIGLEAGRPFRIGYEVRCDGRWRVREVRATAPDSDRPVLELLADGESHWKRRGGEPVPELDGCIDVDISATPFTNTFPIRRLGLEPGESEELTVTYVRVPELLVGPERQRYGCLEAKADGGLYRFEALPSGFTAELPVDAEGLVIDYPGLFRRAWSG